MVRTYQQAAVWSPGATHPPPPEVPHVPQRWNMVRAGLLALLEAKPGKEADVANFLRGGLSVDRRGAGDHRVVALTVWNYEWSRGESNPRPLECHVSAGAPARTQPRLSPRTC